MNSLMVNNLGCVTADWNGLKIWEEKLSELKLVYSMFELSLNIDYDFLQRALKCCTEKCVTTCNHRRYGFWEKKHGRINEYPHVLVVFVFRSFFEEGSGNDYYKPAACKIYNEGSAENKSLICELKKVLKDAWEKVFNEGGVLFGQNQKTTRELFCSRCWLIKNFQAKAGNSQLCNSVRFFKNFGDKILRLHAENYPFDISERFGENFKRLLESPACRLEREYLIDFADNAVADKERFAWFEQLDENSKAALGELLQITIDNKRVPCFGISNIYDFDVDNSVDRIVVKFLLRGPNVVICPFEKRQGRWRHTGNNNCLQQPIWKVTGIIKYEYSNNTIVRTEDVLGRELSECCCSDGYGAFLINAENSQEGIYAPFGRRRIPVGMYFAYAFKWSNGNHFEVQRHIKNTEDAHLVYANDNPIGADRSFVVEKEDESILISIKDDNQNRQFFDFGIKRRSPVREVGSHEKLIPHQNPNHLFINYRKWLSCNVYSDWHYEVNGISVQGTIDKNNLYKIGRLVFCYLGHQYEESCVTFVDFSSEEVCGRFPVLGVGDSAKITLCNSGSLDGSYTVAEDCTTFGISLPGGDWQLNVPIRREGVVFRTEEGNEALSLQFREGDVVVAKDIAIEDLQKLRCTVYCADAAECAVITSMVCVDETTRKCHIPLIKDRDGFVFSDKRRYLASRAGRDGDKMLADLLSSQLRVRSFVIEKHNKETCEAKYCRINIYDPKMEPPVRRPRIDNGLITVELYVPYFTRNCTRKLMKWLPSTGLDLDTGVRELEGFTERYEQLENGRWCISLTKTAMHRDVEGILRTGASILAFMADRGDTGFDRLISGGYCLLGNEHNLQVVQEEWQSASDLHASMHERYGRNIDRLGDMLGMLTLLQWNDWDSIDNGRRELKRRISQLMANINSIGRRADMYMNSLYNTRFDQWSGYIYFAGWYFVEKIYNEMSCYGEEEDGGRPLVEDCRCLSSSTGKRIWSPFLFSRRAYIMTTNGDAQRWWRRYYKGLSCCDVMVDESYPVEYLGLVASILWRVSIDVENGLGDAVNKLYKQILEWRMAVDTRDIVCDDNSAGELFSRTQVLRDVLLELSEIDKGFKEENITGSAHPLFYDLLKIVDAKHWCNNN